MNPDSRELILQVDSLGFRVEASIQTSCLSKRSRRFMLSCETVRKRVHVRIKILCSRTREESENNDTLHLARVRVRVLLIETSLIQVQ